MAAIAIRENGLQAQTITAELFNDFVAFVDRTERTARTYLTNLRQFMAWLRYSAISVPARQDIISYRQWLAVEHPAITFRPELAEGWSYRLDDHGAPLRIKCKATTIKVYLQSVKQFFKWTAANGLYPNIADNIHAPKVDSTHKKDALTAADVLKVEGSIKATAAEAIQAATEAAKDSSGRLERSTEQGKRLYAMFLLAVNCGLRTIEISRANVGDLETVNGQAWLFVWGKGRAEADQRKAIAPEVKAALDDYLKTRADKMTNSSPLFVSTGNRSGGKRIATTTISTMLKKAMQAAGYNSGRITAHSLRHTAAANVMELTGNDIYATQHYLRHADPKTTEIYLENETSAQDAAIAAQLYQHYHGGADDARNQLAAMLDRMTPEQLAQMTGIASAFSR